ncbi:MAG TPA: response regulator [Bryobacteraceae bacterium]|nr:response regulator [Bryobacteraceae bacterium]
MPGILIVDDSLTVRMDLHEAFESAGFTTTLCETVSGAREALARSTFSLIILDVLLPDGDGVDLLREIKTAAATAGTPVMLLTTEAEVQDRMRGLQTGADDYVGKPYETAYVIGRARQLAGKSGNELASSAATPTLLVIDDSATVRESLTSVLSAVGYSVVTAETGEEGLRTAVAVRPQAIIVDGNLPGGIDGATVIRRIKQDVALRHTPCLLLTASEEREDELRALEAGADGYLRKEADANVLLARITAALRSANTPFVAVSNALSLLGPKKILAVDDSATYLNEVSDELRAEGYDVILARSGQEALDLLRVQPVDCILLDVMMPGLSGNETCRRIKGTPAWKEIPLLMLTSLDERTAMVDGINAGADDYIPKSGDFEVLRARLRAQLRRKQYEDENQRVRQELLHKEIEAAQARAAQEIAETRASLSVELERKNKELEAFSYSVSHDLRAPLRSINGFSQLLLQEYVDQLTPKAQDYVRRIHSAGDRMGQLIDDLLELSRVSRAELNRQHVDLSNLARIVAAELEKREPQRQLAIAVEDGLMVEADTRLLRVVLENLFGNAFKFTAKTLQARIEIGAIPAPEGPVYFVRDNGVGFDMAYAHKLFAPFQRLHTESAFPGTGIGLSTVYRIIDRHGGRVWAEGDVGHGAAFFFTLGANDAGGGK